MALSAIHHKKLEAYIRTVADQYGLKDWEVTLAVDPIDPEAGADARVSAPLGRKVAEVELCGDFVTRSREEQRKIIIHEVGHLHFEPMTNFVDETAKKTMGAEAATVFSSAFIQHLEHGVDGVALAVAAFFPLPPPLSRK